MAEEFCYSFDRDNFLGSFPTRQSALAAGISAAANQEPPVEAVFVARREKQSLDTSGLADDLIQSLSRRWRDTGAEQLSQQLHQLNEHDHADLDSALAQTLRDWLARRAVPVKMGRIVSISEHAFSAAGSLR